jgi:glycosyltransferase involved in cell wall biosynthesis
LKLSVLIASEGRETLNRAIASVQPQLKPGDEILVHINNDCEWGHASRNMMMRAARGDYFLFLDDDDEFTPNALKLVRAAIRRKKAGAYIFKMRYADGDELWRQENVVLGNISTIMFCVKAEVALGGTWSDNYEGDFDYMKELEGSGVLISWEPGLIGLVRPA